MSSIGEHADLSMVDNFLVASLTDQAPRWEDYQRGEQPLDSEGGLALYRIQPLRALNVDI